MRRTLAIAALLAWPAVSCGEPPGADELASQPSEPEVVLELELMGDDGAGQRLFAASAPIWIRLTLRNPTEHEVALAFSSGRTHDAIVVAADGRELWRWSDGRMFTQALSEVQLAPNSVSSFQLECDPTKLPGDALPPGRYRATGLIPALAGELRSGAIEFEVE
jgi:hypothetical protein